MPENTEESKYIIKHEAEFITDLRHALKSKYRLFRRNMSANLRYYLRKTFINILYITIEDFPLEYILSLQNQYPDKIIKLLTLHTPEHQYKANLIEKFEYSLRNKTYLYELYEYPLSENNVHVYGISSDGFENLKYNDEIYQFKYLAHFTKCARFAAKKLKTDIIHAENIPLLLGKEFNQENFSCKLLQMFHHYPVYQEIEPFWAAINLSDNKTIKRILNDKVIKKNLAALFGIKTPLSYAQINNCLEFIYNNFEEYRNTVDKEEIVNENILIKRLNDRVTKIFPQAFPKEADTFNPIYYTVKNSEFYGFNHSTDNFPEWIQSTNVLKRGYISSFKNKVLYPINTNNFREARDKNKKYLIKEFEKERILTKFTDYTLFNENDIKIRGYLDYFYRGVLILAILNNESTEEEIKTTALSVLKCFEQREIVQIIFNTPKDFNNKYFESFMEFIGSQKTMKGKWLLIEGKINLQQFTSSADIILMPFANTIGIENTLYTSLKNGCIPVLLSNGACADIVTDIYDDLNIGCGFKGVRVFSADTDKESISDTDLFTNTLFKALSFYKLNSSGWNRLVNNALEYDNSWNFELIERYNSVYDKII